MLLDWKKLTQQGISHEDLQDLIDQTIDPKLNKTLNPYTITTNLQFKRDPKAKGKSSRGWLRRRRLQLKALMNSKKLKF